VSTVLQNFGYDADELTADLQQKDRDRVLERVRKKTLRFLVATDVAARGLDIPNLSHVIQYEPSKDLEDYIHRAGRTGRVGKAGVAMTLVTHLESFVLDRIAKRFSIDLQEWPLPTDDDVAAVVTERVTTLLEARLRDRDSQKTERSKRFVSLGRSLADNEDESAIIAMLLDDYYQEMLHAPLPQPSEPSKAPSDKEQKKPATSRNRPRPRNKKRR